MEYNSALKSVIIVAGGSGKRMNSQIPKQFLLLNNKPILMHSIEQFFLFNDKITIILVLPENQINIWNDLCEKHGFIINHSIVVGGKERFHSVKNGLQKITNITGFVAVHDGVRPLVSKSLILRGVIAAQKYNAVVPVIPVVNSLRQIIADKTKHIDRQNLRIVQTPQIFDVSILKNAYNVNFNPKFTDDASVVEANGVDVFLFDGEEKNIKITNKLDLYFADFLINNS
ncbi:MAG: 2-C-methyl-D-erythritol 4-phosphate cytidylyltransferase [Bacteroidales bacterium]|nr:2-C-methyl-D-erythritol 4-phosphate cytidylyltransferase [Bacteroidales bacterium]